MAYRPSVIVAIIYDYPRLLFWCWNGRVVELHTRLQRISGERGKNAQL